MIAISSESGERHQHQLIDVRANRAQFLDLPLRHIAEDAEVPLIALPSVQGDESGLPEGSVEAIGGPEFTGVYTTPDQLSEELVTLTLLPRSRWQTLLNLDTIRVRDDSGQRLLNHSSAIV